MIRDEEDQTEERTVVARPSVLSELVAAMIAPTLAVTLPTSAAEWNAMRVLAAAAMRGGHRLYLHEKGKR